MFTIFFGRHHVYVNPVVTLLGIPAAFLEEWMIMQSSSSNARSLDGLKIQAIVFIFFSVSWIWRFKSNTGGH